MSYRNGTYVAFNGCDTTNPVESDMKYYGLLQAWNKESKFNFTFSDSHKKTYQVRDDSLRKTLESRLLERMRNSKNMLLIISDNSNWNRGMLNYEIEKAIEHYKIPIIATYTGFTKIMKPAELSNLWPRALKKGINNETVKAIHIPFKQVVIADAISQFDVHTSKLKSSLSYYSKEAYQRWGL